MSVWQGGDFITRPKVDVQGVAENDVEGAAVIAEVVCATCISSLASSQW
jgi:hypothetical protein